jgi:DNA polymerase type B, organellar and viral
MPKDSVYQLHGLIEQNIRRSYTGGSVDVYIPHNRLTPWLTNDNIQYDKLYYYDVNSLYPYIMANKFMPFGKPIFFNGDISIIDPQSFGFFYCEITSPDNLEHPILQRRIKTINGLRTISGLGKWTDWIFSEEMYNAIKFGYSFKILKGYTFNKGNLFDKYINKMYNLRLQYDKTNPMNLIAKLLMNSLYGKFGMKDEITSFKILNNTTPVDKANISDILDLYNNNIIDIIELDNYTLILIKDIADMSYNEKDDIWSGTEVNISIASAITSYSRIHMSQFKNNPDFKLYYSDTDSITINKPLQDSMIGSALGLMKLENVINKAVFLAPKVYALITNDGKEIVKVKGLSHDVISKLTFNDLEVLLIKDSSR